MARLPLPPAVETVLADLRATWGPSTPGGALDPSVAAIGQFPPRGYERIRSEISRELGYAGGAGPMHPASAWLLLMHNDGHIREAALDRINQAAPGPFFVVALLARLNDWVPQIRATAGDCALRVLPITPPEVLAAGLLSVLEDLPAWGRWSAIPVIIETTLERADVADAMAALLCGPDSWRLAAFSALLRRPMLDRHLLAMGFGAMRPEVRAMALLTLIRGEARWVVGSDWQWIDKSLGRRRLVPRLTARPVVPTVALDELVMRAAADPTATVRRIAAAALIAHAPELADPSKLARQLALDSSAAVRWRAEYYLRTAAATP
jgi:hypothetical protein